MLGDPSMNQSGGKNCTSGAKPPDSMIGTILPGVITPGVIGAAFRRRSIDSGDTFDAAIILAPQWQDPANVFKSPPLLPGRRRTLLQARYGHRPADR
jgi:hypothetical protein